MRIVKTSTLKAFYAEYPQAEQPFKAWIQEAKKESWKQPHDIKKIYRSADILPDNWVVFNIGVVLDKLR